MRNTLAIPTQCEKRMLHEMHFTWERRWTMQLVRAVLCASDEIKP